MVLASKCQRTIINVFFSSNSQPAAGIVLLFVNVKEQLSMFSFQAIHNMSQSPSDGCPNVKEQLSMFSFQAIHNSPRTNQFHHIGIKQVLHYLPVLKGSTTKYSHLGRYCTCLRFCDFLFFFTIASIVTNIFRCKNTTFFFIWQNLFLALRKKVYLGKKIYKIYRISAGGGETNWIASDVSGWPVVGIGRGPERDNETHQPTIIFDAIILSTMAVSPSI